MESFDFHKFHRLIILYVMFGVPENFNNNHKPRFHCLRNSSFTEGRKNRKTFFYLLE